MKDKNRTLNRLAKEQSPYLLQHADNPVDWYPWGTEAFEKAKTENKPVFLSIGYSTCHWCHVMAHESFQDEEVAKQLNQNYISIKVDREERPDIDSVYMAVCQTLTGSGGWPLTVIMTPEKQPFFAGTYFPRESSQGSAGLLELLAFIHQQWESDQHGLLEEGKKVIDFLKKQAEREERFPDSPENLIQEAKKYFQHSYDPKWGGFGVMPKFPSPHNLLFLMAQDQEDAVEMAEKTLVQMYRGGIFDHIGGGFCRYSTDDKWLVPHFEKMLYDNAMLLLTYTEAYRISGKPLYEKVAHRIASYVLEELTHREGGFYCSQDADSNGREGSFYVFSPGEIKEILGEQEGEAFCRKFDITMQGNFEGKSIPNLLRNPKYQQSADAAVRKRLRKYRQDRMKLHKDDKILTGWNGLMIAAMARAASVLEKPEYLAAAQSAANFIWSNLQQNEGRLFARWRQGQAAYWGTLDDYTFFIWGLLECYNSTFEAEYLRKAVCTGEKLLELFFDEEKGGCFLYGKDSEQLILRPKEAYDGALPSGNSVAALVMGRLAFFTGKQQWRKAWERQKAFLARQAHRHPAGYSFFLWQLCEEERIGSKLICVSAQKPPLDALQKLDVDLMVKTKENQAEIECLAPFLKNYEIPAEGTVYYLCQNQRCSSPVYSLEAVKQLIKGNDYQK